MKYLFIILFMVVVGESKAQNSFGFEFGTYFHSYQGTNDFDSIRVIVNDIDRGELFGGLFYEVDLKGRFQLHSKFSIRQVYINNTVFNSQEQCLFCPVKKGALSAVTSFSLELLPQVELINLNRLKFKIFGGLSTNFNVLRERPEISFNGRHSGVARVINSLDHSINPVTLSWAYGASAEYNRFILWVKAQHQSNYSKEIEISGQVYNFKNSWQFLSFSVGYRFYSLKSGHKAR